MGSVLLLDFVVGLLMMYLFVLGFAFCILLPFGLFGVFVIACCPFVGFVELFALLFVAGCLSCLFCVGFGV